VLRDEIHDRPPMLVAAAIAVGAYGGEIAPGQLPHDRLATGKTTDAGKAQAGERDQLHASQV